MMSIFSVARAPGLPLVYLGVHSSSALGVVWMFYIKPYLAMRKAALRWPPRPLSSSEEVRLACSRSCWRAEPARGGA